MDAPKQPSNETQRLEALKKLNILDTPDEERFDRITNIAQQFFNVPIALISLVDEDRQHLIFGFMQAPLSKQKVALLSAHYA